MSIEVVPGTVNVSPGNVANVAVAIHNTLADPIRNVELVTFSADDVKVETIPAKSVDQIAANGQSYWTLVLTGTLESPTVGHLYLWARYGRSSQIGVEQTNRVDLTINRQSVETAEQVASVEVTTTLDALTDQQGGSLYLIVANKTDKEITVKGVITKAPAFVLLSPQTPNSRQPLPAHGHLLIGYDIATTGAVQLGKHLLLFTIPIEWESRGAHQTGDLLVGHEVEVGVFGESQLLSLLAIPAGIPFFLVLPGFLVLIMLRLFLRLSRSKLFDVAPEEKSTDFWALAVTLSFLLSLLLYPIITGITNFGGSGRNLMKGYGFQDYGVPHCQDHFGAKLR